VSTPTRIQLKRTKGWHLPPNTVVVSRPSKWGNPFKVGRDGTAKECVDRYAARIGILTNAIVQELRGKNLACWCKLYDEKGLRVPCHADVLLRLANQYGVKVVTSRRAVRRLNARGELPPPTTNK
jgi:hypothetical protein